jgi:hypothetical protein
VKRLLAIAVLLSACADPGAYPTAAPAFATPEPFDDAMVQIAPVPEAVVGMITFGTSFDPDTLDIPKPLTRFKRTYPNIAWSAHLSHGVDAAFVSWVVARQSELGDEEIVFEVEEPIDGASVTNLANSGALASHVGNVAGTYIMRYVASREVLAEGVFTLVE